MDRRFKFMKKKCPQVVVCPCPGAIYMYMTIIINGHGHMTKMAAMAIYSKNL